MGNAPSESECKELLEANGGSDADGIGLDGLLAAGKKLAGFKPDAGELTSRSRCSQRTAARWAPASCARW